MPCAAHRRCETYHARGLSFEGSVLETAMPSIPTIFCATWRRNVIITSTQPTCLGFRSWDSTGWTTYASAATTLTRGAGRGCSLERTWVTDGSLVRRVQGFPMYQFHDVSCILFTMIFSSACTCPNWASYPVRQLPAHVPNVPWLQGNHPLHGLESAFRSDAIQGCINVQKMFTSLAGSLIFHPGLSIKLHQMPLYSVY